MSKYTTEVRYICETYAGLSESTGYDKVDDIINAACPYIFDFDFPIHDESHRGELEAKILRHYYLREIGFETVGIWKLKLNAKLNEIMPYYNQLYATAELITDPFEDVDYQRISNGTENTDKKENNTTSQTTSGTAKNTSTEQTTGSGNKTSGEQIGVSDTPQGELFGVIQNNYLSAATNKNSSDTYSDLKSRNVTDNGETKGTLNGSFNTEGKVNKTDSNTEHVKGKMYSASKAKLLQEYRKTILNIDMQIVNELHDLFMLIY